MKSSIIVLALAAVAACRSTSAPEPAAQQVGGTDVSVALGDTIQLGGTTRIVFREVKADSRCPVDAVCVWSGNAEVVVGLSAASTPPRTASLNTDAGTKELVYGALHIQLTGLDPAPYSNDTTRAYVAHLRWRYLPD